MNQILSRQPDIVVTPHDRAYPSVWLHPIELYDMRELGAPDVAASEFLTTRDIDILANPDEAYHDLRESPGYTWGLHEVLGGYTNHLVGIATLWTGYGSLPLAGVSLYRKENLHSGMGAATFTGLTTFAYQKLNAPAVAAETVLANRRCIRSLRNLGFVVEDSETHVQAYGPKRQWSAVLRYVAFNPDAPLPDSGVYPVAMEEIARSRDVQAANAARYIIELS